MGHMRWHIAGTYFEACNCDAICPCRRIDRVPGGRSTHGVCAGALSWVIDAGSAGDVDLGGAPVALAFRYSDDEAGSPWTWVLYLDARCSADQRAALEGIFTGALGGDALNHFPWARKRNAPIAVRAAQIDVRHERRRQRLRIRDHVDVEIRDRYATEASVGCVIPGYERGGEELVADRIRLDDEELVLRVTDVCGYASTFDYAGEPT